MKKKLIALLCLLCLLLVALAACGEPSSQNTDPEGPTTENERKTITIGIPESVLVVNYDTNAYTLWLEEVSGYDIEFKKYASNSSDYKKQLATETANETELPDILYRFRMTDDEVLRYGEDGYFIDLSEYFEDKEKSANFWNMTEKYLTEEEQEKIWLLIHSDYRTGLDDSENVSGPIYVFPTMETSLIDIMTYKPMINQDWLDVLKLDAPTNLQQLKDVLIAFRDRDPNGNGIPDEVPMLGCTVSSRCDLVEWIINFFLYYDEENYFNVGKDGKLYATQTTEAYRNALKYLRELVAEGLLNVNTFTYGSTKLKSVLNNSNMVGVTVAHPSLSFTEGSDEIHRWAALDLYGNVYEKGNIFAKDVFITDSCDDPDAAWEVLMHMCSEESAFRQRYGEQGVDWDYADEGTVSFLGIPAKIKIFNDIWSSVNNSCWSAISGGIYPYSENEQNQITGEESPFIQAKYTLLKTLRENYDKALAATDDSMECPLLRFNEEEDDIAKTRADAKKQVASWRAYFMNGTKDINSEDDWKDYLTALDQAGLDDYLIASQLCYDRMYKSGT